ncbi:MAG TPA: UbiA family prenyltransferase [Pseudolysinimonas sp.]|nr:UbiA family prenyltransferase [Pseudolysinimonas sp.]
MARLRALLLSTHPGPGGAVAVIAVLLAITAGLDVWRVALIGLVMVLDQASVGLSNDWIDADRDRAVGRTDKPVARGDIAPRLARDVAIAAAVASVIASVPLGGAAVLAHLLFLTGAWAYNAGLKNSAISVLPYLVSFGTLPAIVTLARDQPALPAWWVVAAGALLGAGAHFANVLPDLEDDAATGVRGLPHRIGRLASLVTVWIALPAAALCLALGIGPATPLAIGGLVASLTLAAAGLVAGLTRAPSRALFRLVIAAALVDVVMLLIGGSRGL